MQIQRLQPSERVPAREIPQPRSASQTPPLPGAQERRGEVQPLEMHRELLEQFSEWYLRMGKTYENTRSYRQAISAYEKSYAVSPAFSKAESIESVRGKLLDKEKSV